jgi:hypothetical protein
MAAICIFMAIVALAFYTAWRVIIAQEWIGWAYRIFMGK